MPSKSTLDRFVARVVEGAHALAIEEFYTSDASMQENNGAPRVGWDLLIAHEPAALGGRANCRGKVLLRSSAIQTEVIIKTGFS